MGTRESHSLDKSLAQATPCGFSHIAVPSRDLTQSKRFFVDVLGGSLSRDEPAVARAEFENFAIVMGLQASGATPANAEYPHYAFTVAAQDFMGIKQRLEAFGVPTHDPWGRENRPHALMYFRDPSGNQFELFCPSGFNAVPLRLGHRAGGDYVIDFAALCYSALKPPVAGNAAIPDVRPKGFNHMTIPVRDMHEAKRFFVAALGATVAFERPAHITVVCGGAEIGLSPETGGWTAPDAAYPHYTFFVRPDELTRLRERLQAHAVPTSEVWTRDGRNAAFHFRDPSGNLWEAFCESGSPGNLLRGKSAGGDFTPDLLALNYDIWKDPGK